MSFVGQLQAFIDGKSASPASVVSYVKALRYFVAFLEETGGPVTPLGLLPIHIIIKHRVNSRNWDMVLEL